MTANIVIHPLLRIYSAIYSAIYSVIYSAILCFLKLFQRLQYPFEHEVDEHTGIGLICAVPPRPA